MTKFLNFVRRFWYLILLAVVLIAAGVFLLDRFVPPLGDDGQTP